METDTTQPGTPPQAAATVPQIHPRDLACDAAGRELVEFAESWQKKHSLTSVELLYILNQVMAAQLRLDGTKERYGIVNGTPIPEQK